MLFIMNDVKYSYNVTAVQTSDDIRNQLYDILLRQCIPARGNLDLM